mmetsp:Transcript_115254/g.332948  ORF Transcript_115254/g.332948 Transcript_115254/m.332948 type:complete len:274 (+) Transcript_115254:3-824(+)
MTSDAVIPAAPAPDPAAATSAGAASDLAAPTDEEPCFAKDVAWMPDMAGESQESSAHNCQARCADTQGCARFSYLKRTQACKLHDMFSVRSPDIAGAGFVSGPFACWDKADHEAYVKADEQTILPKAFGCVEVGAMYAPAMGAVRNIQGTPVEVVRGCRWACSDEEGCEHFTVTLPNMCHLAGAGATKLAVSPMVLSGAVSGCGAPEFVMKSATWLGVMGSGGSATWRFAALASTGIAFAAVAILWRHRRFGRAATPRYDVSEDEALRMIVCQ